MLWTKVWDRLVWIVHDARPFFKNNRVFILLGNVTGVISIYRPGKDIVVEVEVEQVLHFFNLRGRNNMGVFLLVLRGIHTPEQISLLVIFLIVAGLPEIVQRRKDGLLLIDVVFVLFLLLFLPF